MKKTLTAAMMSALLMLGGVFAAAPANAAAPKADTSNTSTQKTLECVLDNPVFGQHSVTCTLTIGCRSYWSSSTGESGSDVDMDCIDAIA